MQDLTNNDVEEPSEFNAIMRDSQIDHIEYHLKHIRDSVEVTDTIRAVIDELVRATSKFGRFNSAHEGYAVFNEESDELWDHVKVNQSKRDLKAMKKEAIQCAAMAIRFAVDCCNEKTGRV